MRNLGIDSLFVGTGMKKLKNVTFWEWESGILNSQSVNLNEEWESLFSDLVNVWMLPPFQKDSLLFTPKASFSAIGIFLTKRFLTVHICQEVWRMLEEKDSYASM